VNPFYADLPWRAAFRMTGRDRHRFLHGMCTNDIKKLQAGQSCAAAIVSRQGKMVADLQVLAERDALLAVTDRAGVPGTIAHLQKFIVADDVTMTPVPASIVFATPLVPFSVDVPEIPDPVLRGTLLVVEEPKREAVHARLASLGFSRLTESEFEDVRIVAGAPRWGIDMGPEYLPMESGLEPVAVSYTKGCYIGQEVIQRVKTYSEPPRMLVQLETAGAAPGEKITAKGEEIGHVTSAAREVALGYVRKEFKTPGIHVEVAGRPAHVRSLPWQAGPS
jgi:folate-binding protein YgfZ